MNLHSEIPGLIDKLIEPVLQPPSARMAIMMIDETGRLHVAAISGMLQQSDNQAAIDAAYPLIDRHLELLREQLHEVLYVIAKGNGLEARSINDTNLQTRLDIEAQLKKET